MRSALAWLVRSVRPLKLRSILLGVFIVLTLAGLARAEAPCPEQSREELLQARRGAVAVIEAILTATSRMALLNLQARIEARARPEAWTPLDVAQLALIRWKLSQLPLADPPPSGPDMR